MMQFTELPVKEEHTLHYYLPFQNKGHVPQAQIAPSSDEYVLDQLSTCEEKLLKLLEELDGQDLNAVVKQMEEEEVGDIIVSLSLYGVI